MVASFWSKLITIMEAFIPFIGIPIAFGLACCKLWRTS